MKGNHLLRVAMIIQGYYPRIGGAEQQVAALAPRLMARGVELMILTRKYPGLQAFEQIQDVPVYRLPIPGSRIVASLYFTLAALLLLNKLRPDVLHAHELLSPTTTAVAAKRIYRTPVVAKVLRGGTLGDIAIVMRNRFGKQRLQHYKNQVDTFISISREIEDELAELGVPSERRRFIPNGVDTERFTPVAEELKWNIRQHLNINADPVAIFTGRLSAEKRLDLLFNAWKTIRLQYPHALLLILGTGEQEKKLRMTAGTGIRFEGSIKNVVPYLQASDLFILPSTAEGLSNAMLEAMACGIPVLATQVGGANDVIQHNKSGWLIPSNNLEALINGWLVLFSDPTLRQQYSVQGRQKIVETYNIEKTADELVQLYQGLTMRNNQ